MSEDATRTAIGRGRILPDGTRIADRYRIVRLLGVGGMGMVYLAQDEVLDIEVALKILRTDGRDGAERLERFRRELVLARQISHRNVVRIHDIGQDGELYFISMDYVAGRSLKQVLETDGPLEPRRALAIAADLADALAEAHRGEVVHRDVKPANVLIAADRACLTDFGIARSLQEDGLTRTGEIVGTLDYLSPEQALGKPIDGRTDIYALGLLLYEMLQGKRPFAGETAEEVLAQRTLAAPRDLGQVTARAGPAVRRILERCLAIDPAARYADAAALAADLRAGGAPRRLRLPRAGLAAASLALLVAVSTWFVLTREPAPASSAAQVTAVAVLPFGVTDPGGTLDSLSAVLAEQLGDGLAAAASLQVVSGERVASTLRDLKLSPASLSVADRKLLAELLDADWLVAGRLARADTALRIDARLLRADSGEAAHVAEVALADVGELFTAVEGLGNELRGALHAGSVPAASAEPAVPSTALVAYADGVDRLTRDNALAAVEPLRQAVAAAPDFARAWDRLAAALSAAGRDRDALAAARSAVAALGERSDRGASLIRARQAALDGDLDAAAKRLEDLLAQYPADGEAQLMLGEIYGDAGRLQEAAAVLERLVADSPNHPQAWYLLGKFAILGGDSRRAIDDYLVKALVVQNRLGNAQGRADVLNALGIAWSQLGDSEAASRRYREALALREEIGDERGVAAVLANLARIDLQAGRYHEARDGLQQARDRLADIGDRWTVANLDNELGYLEEQRGQFRAALAHYRDALRLRDDLGDQRALAESYNNVGYAYLLLGEYDNASVFNERSLASYRETGNDEGVMLASQSRGILEIARGRYDDALKALLESLRISRELGDRQAEAIAEGYIGRARHLQGRYAAAAESLADARSAFDDLGDDRGLAEYTLLAASLALDCGQYDAAGAALEQANRLMAADDNRARRSLGLRIAGELEAARGEQAAAADLYGRALAEAEASGERLAILQAQLAVAASADGPAPDRLQGLREVYDDAQALGHALLRYDAGLAYGAALAAAGRDEQAGNVLRDTLEPQRGAAAYHEAWRVSVVLAGLLERADRGGEAALLWQRAATEVRNALAEQNDAQRTAFAGLPLVREILARGEGT